MSFEVAEIAGVVVYPLKKFYDDRGWLAELFRHDELDGEFYPEMAYISFTRPGIQRLGRTSMLIRQIFFVLSVRQPSTFDCGTTGRIRILTTA